MQPGKTEIPQRRSHSNAENHGTPREHSKANSNVECGIALVVFSTMGVFVWPLAVESLRRQGVPAGLRLLNQGGLSSYLELASGHHVSGQRRNCC